MIEDRIDGRGLLSFVPAATDRELRLQWGDCLDLYVGVPVDVFEVIWKSVDQGRQIVLGARVLGLSSKHPYAPRSAPYIWDTSNKSEHHKEVEEFWFSEIVRLDYEEHSLTGRVWSPGAAAEDVYRIVQADFGRHTQMHRICVAVLEQAEKEAERQGMSFEDSRKILVKSVEMVRNLQYYLRKMNPDSEIKRAGELWFHRDFDRDHIEGLKALDDFQIDEREVSAVVRDLMEMSWLRVDELEWAIVDALVYNTAFGVGEETKKGDGSIVQGLVYDLNKGDLLKMGWRLMAISAVWRLVQCCLGLGIILYVWTYFEDHRNVNFVYACTVIIVVILLLWIVAGCPFGRRHTRLVREERQRLFMSMRAAYLTLQCEASLLNPCQLMSALLTAQEKGAIWPPAALALINRAASRSPSVWYI